MPKAARREPAMRTWSGAAPMSLQVIEGSPISESTIWMPPSRATIFAVTTVECSRTASVGVTLRN